MEFTSHAETERAGDDGNAVRPLPPLTDHYTAWLIVAVAARITRNGVNYYTRSWGIGSAEYRLLMALGLEDACSATTAANAADIDKAATSRGLQRLEAEGLVETIRRGRTLEVRLTEAGRNLRRELKSATDRRDCRLTHGFKPDEIERLRADLRRLLDNLPYMNQ